MNVPFTEADLASHDLWMCPLTWQDHFNFHEKGMTPVDMHLLLMFLKAIRRICAQEKSTAQSNKKISKKSKKGNKQPGTESTVRVSKEVCFKKYCNHCKKHGGGYAVSTLKTGGNSTTFFVQELKEGFANSTKMDFMRCLLKLK
jgi:hypothetical protein